MWMIEAASMRTSTSEPPASMWRMAAAFTRSKSCDEERRWTRFDQRAGLMQLRLPRLEEGAATAAIRGVFDRNAPGMVARFGSTEIKAVLWPRLPWGVKRLAEGRVFSNMTVASG